MRIGVVAVPLTREQQEQVALADYLLTDGGTMKHALALAQVKQLVLVQLAATLQFEVVAVGMATGGIGVTGLYFLVAHRADG